MLVRRIVARVVGAAGIGLLIVLVLARSAGPRPPVLTLVRIEPAGVIDDTGVEMWLMTLSVSNSDNLPTLGQPRPETHLYVDEAGKGIEAKVGNRWVALGGTLGRLGACSLAPGQKSEKLLLMPGATESCRISLKYTGGSSSFWVKELAFWGASRLPLSLRSRFSPKFWMWVNARPWPGGYGPSSNWREISAELPCLAAK